MHLFPPYAEGLHGTTDKELWTRDLDTFEDAMDVFDEVRPSQSCGATSAIIFICQAHILYRCFHVIHHIVDPRLLS